MFKRIGAVISVLIFMFTLVTLVGCYDDVKQEPKIEVSTSNIQLELNNTQKITATIKDADDTLKVLYTSKNVEIATVDVNGLITAVGYGDTTINVYLEKYPNVKVEVKVTVPLGEISLSGDTNLYVGETTTLSAVDEKGGNQILWESSDTLIANVDQNGLVTAISQGVVSISAISQITGESKSLEMNIIVPDVTSIEVSRNSDTPIKSLSVVSLTASVLPAGASQDVTWTSSNPEIATVDQNGKVNTLKSGQVDITATSVANNQISGTISLTIEVDPVSLIRSFNVENPIAQLVTTYGSVERTETVYGSVSKYWPGNLNLTVNIIPITQMINGAPNPYIGQVATQEMLNAAEFKTVRSGILKPEIANIIYHDTGNNSFGATAQMHANYIVGNDNFTTYKARSWHYTVDETQVIQHLPDNEVAWQGDTYAAYTTTIGIETCVNQGSDLYTTWHRTAKLMAGLIVKYDLQVSDVKQHYDYSQKNCPQTLRRNNLYANAIELIRAEYLVLTELEGYTITFKSNNPDYVNDLGRIIKLDTTTKRVSYTVHITNDQGYDQSVLLFSTLPAKTF